MMECLNFKSRKDYFKLITEIESSIQGEMKPILGVDTWFLIRIKLGFLFHHYYNGKNVISDVKNTIPYEKIGWRQLPKQIKLALNSWLRLVRVRNRFKGMYNDKTLYIKNRSNETIIDGSPYDPYNDPFFENGGDFAVIYPAEMVDSPLKDLYTHLRLYYTSIFNVIWWFNQTLNKVRNNVKLVVQGLERFAGKDFSTLAPYLEKLIINDSINYRIIRDIIKTTRPNTIHTPCYYCHYVKLYIRAANNLGINAIEYQHSLMADTHFAYGKWNINSESMKMWFPAKFKVWSSVEEEHIKRNFNSAIYRPQIEIVGNLYLRKRISEMDYQDTPNNNKVLICLQGQWFPDFVEDYIRNDRNRIWYLRLHPRYPGDKGRALQLKDNQPNVVLDEACNRDLFDLINEIPIVMTSFSGTALEALEFKRGVVIFGEEGYISYESYIREGKMHYVSDYQSMESVF